MNEDGRNEVEADPDAYEWIGEWVVALAILVLGLVLVYKYHSPFGYVVIGSMPFYAFILIYTRFLPVTSEELLEVEENNTPQQKPE